MEDRQERADRSADRLDARQSITETPPKAVFNPERDPDGSISYAYFYGSLLGILDGIEQYYDNPEIVADCLRRAHERAARVMELQAEDASR